MTEKLYYKDAYIKDFTATVLDVCEDGERYCVTLDRTAFFPEEGGQMSDGGTLGGARVLHVTEQDGVIYHYVDRPLAIGDTVRGELDFDERFSKMQVHSAEHILSGIIHSLFGLDNVGFHLGDPEVTMDISGILSREELDRVELLANRVVFSNQPVSTYFPTEDELAATEYRSKSEIDGPVRLVKIGDCDVCACCAPHVAYTGEIGLVKILDFEKHRGGLRLYIAAGERALADYRNKYDNARRISALLSEPQSAIADGVERLLAANEELRATHKALRLDYARLKAQTIPRTDGNVVILCPTMSIEELREICNVATDRVGGLLVTLCGTEGDYKYVISSRELPVSSMAKDINAALLGRGGGRGNMIQGSFYTELSNIEQYFK